MKSNRVWSKEIRIAAFGLAALGGLAFLWFFRGLLSPLAISAIFAYVLYPVVGFLTARTRLKRTGAVIVVYLLTIVILLAVPAVLTPVIVNQVQEFELDFESLMENYQMYIDQPFVLGAWVIYPNQFMPAMSDVSVDSLNPIFESSLKAVEIITTNLIWVLVSLVTIFYMMLDGHRLVHWIIRIAPHEFRPDARILINQLRMVWSDYLRSQLAFMLVVGVVDSIVWLAIGLPGAVFLGLLTGLTSFVHEIGAIVSGILSVGVALLLGSHFLPMSNFWFAVLVLILYLILTAIKNVWIRPVIVGRHVHLHSGVVFVIILGALVFYGALAAFIAVPVFVSFLVVGRYLRRRILGMPPFAKTADPSDYFNIQLLETSETENE